MLNDDKALKPEVQRFEPSLIFKEVLVRCNKEDRDGIITQYINILSRQKREKKVVGVKGLDEDYAHNLIKELITHKKWLNKKQKDSSKNALTETYYASPKILSLFEDKIEDQRDFISEETISKFATTFSNDDVEDKEMLNAKTKLLLKFKEVITSKGTDNIIVSLQTLLESENQKPYRVEKENLLKCIENIFAALNEQFLDISTKASYKPHLNSFADTIVSGITTLNDWDQKKIFIFLLLKLTDILEESQVTKIDVYIRDFFNNADIDSIKFIFDKLDKTGIEELIHEYSDLFQQRVLQEQPIFDLSYRLAPREIRTQWMIKLISSYPKRALSKLKELNYKVDDKKKTVEALLQTVAGVGTQEKGSLYEAVNKMKCANDSGLRDTFASQIKPLLKSSDENQQQVGYTAFQGAPHFSEPVKRDITREIIEWLRPLPLTDAGQTYTIKSVLINWNILESPVKEYYIDFVFDKLIKRGINIDNICLGFEVLYEIKPKYEDRYTYFDDVFARTEKEGNAPIKAELKNGLLKLKPPRLNKQNRSFWIGVEELPLNSPEKS